MCEEGRGELVVTIRELEERVVELQREHQEEREGHHEELKSAIESMEEHQERFVVQPSSTLTALVGVLVFVRRKD